MAYMMLVAPVTGAVANTQFNATDADKVTFAWNGVAPTAADAVLIYEATSTGRVPVMIAAGTQATLTATIQSIVLEGGVLYIVDKSITAAATGIDVITKPRIAKP